MNINSNTSTSDKRKVSSSISMPRLVAINQLEEKYSDIAIRHPQHIIGRSDRSSFCIPSLYISKTHCTFDFTGGVWTLCDKSTYGTFVNGTKLKKGEKHVLEGGDEICIGEPKFTYVFCIDANTEPDVKKTRLAESCDQSAVQGSPEDLFSNSGESEVDLLIEKHLDALDSVVNNANRNLAPTQEHPSTKACDTTGPQKEDEESENHKMGALLADDIEVIATVDVTSEPVQSTHSDGILSSSRYCQPLPLPQIQAPSILPTSILTAQLAETSAGAKNDLQCLTQEQLCAKNLMLEQMLMSTILEKEKMKEEMNKILEEKEAQRISELKKIQTEAAENTTKVLQKLHEELQNVRLKLDTECKELQDKKEKLEEFIKDEMQKEESQCGSSPAALKELHRELKRIKRHLQLKESKKDHFDQVQNTTMDKESVSQSNVEAKQELLNTFGELMESELQCSICNELFIKAVTLNCAHTFCKCCFTQWKAKKRNCPICRTKVSSESYSIHLDNFIEKMIENLTEDVKEKRKQILEERKVLEEKLNINTGSSASGCNASDESVDSDEVISIGSDSESGEDDEYDDEDYHSSPVYRGYGGYGRCFCCGRRGHWANSCPYR